MGIFAVWQRHVIDCDTWKHFRRLAGGGSCQVADDRLPISRHGWLQR